MKELKRGKESSAWFQLVIVRLGGTPMASLVELGNFRLAIGVRQPQQIAV